MAITLAEVVMSMAIVALVSAGVIYGYVMASTRAEWSAYSLAAHSLAIQSLEQTRAAKWDPLGYPPTDELVASNFPTTVSILDIPITGTNIVYATNITTITTVSTNPPLKMIQATCLWPFRSSAVFSNSILSYRAADQ